MGRTPCPLQVRRGRGRAGGPGAPTVGEGGTHGIHSEPQGKRREQVGPRTAPPLGGPTLQRPAEKGAAGVRSPQGLPPDSLTPPLLATTDALFPFSTVLPFPGGVTELGSQSTRPFQIDLLHSPLLGSRPALNPVSTSRSQMRTAQHEELRRPARCHTASKGRSSGSSLGPVLIHHAPGVRDDARHPGTNSPSRPFLKAGRRGPPAAWGRTGSGSLPIPGGSLTCPRPGW